MSHQDFIINLFGNQPKFIRRSIAQIFTAYSNYKLKRLKTPKIITFFITNKCNLKCSHCFYNKELNKDTAPELTLAEIEKITKSFKNRVDELLITGGEPFLRKDIIEICRLFYKNCNMKKLRITTNGYLPDKTCKDVKEIKKIGFDKISICVSIDGFEKVHNQIRGVSDSFSKAITTINKLKEIKGVDLDIITTIHSGNYDQISKLIEFFKKMNVKHRLQYVRSSWRDVRGIEPNLIAEFNPKAKECSMLLKKEDILKLDERINKSTNDKLQKVKRKYFINHLYDNKKMINCKAGIIDSVIYPNGDVALCEMLKPFANLKDFNYDFYKLWASENANLLRNKIQNCFCTHSCNILRSIPYNSKAIMDILDKRN